MDEKDSAAEGVSYCVKDAPTYAEGSGPLMVNAPVDSLRRRIRISGSYSPDSEVILYSGDCRDVLDSVPSGSVRLALTSPPYNLGKPYEKRTKLEAYLAEQAEIIREVVRVVSDDGSICWQVGNYVDSNEVVPLDIALFPIFKAQGLKLRNRIVWHFEHGLHCNRRLSGRHETILWFTKSDKYVFNLDPIRVPQKYPGKKAFKGPRLGQFTSHPLGKNPGDVWIIPNVKHNHVEKTHHPCQFPVELAERLILALTNVHDLVIDPFIGVGTTAVAAVLHGRRAIGADVITDYIETAKERVKKAADGNLRVRVRNTPVYQPQGSVARKPFERAKTVNVALF